MPKNPMNNPARAETDKLLEDLEKRIAREYDSAAKEIKSRAEKYFARFAEQDAEKLALVNSGELSRTEYLKWRTSAIAYGQNYTAMVNDLTRIAVESDRMAVELSKGALLDIFTTNANYAAYEVEKLAKINTSFTLYNRDTVARLIKDNPTLLPALNPKSATAKRLAANKDLVWNKRHMNSAILQGVLQGDSMDKIARRLRSVTDMDRRAAIRNARTMTTSAENAGKMHSYERAEEYGIKVQKMWVATHDDRTRESHAFMDGEVRDNDEPFSNKLMYPGDPSGDAEEVYNCRCAVVAYTQFSTVPTSKYREDNANLDIGGMSYDDWRNQHKS